MAGFRLAIDFGTSNTVGVLRWPDGRTRHLLFDGTPLLPSAIYLDGSGTILAGRDAIQSMRLEPHRFEPYPKRRIGDGTVWLGEREIPVIDLVAAVLRRVAAEARRVADAAPDSVTITHPVAWASARRAVLNHATARAGLPEPRLVVEPVAAMWYFTDTAGARVPDGWDAVVYDFGAGTFDATVVRRTGDGFDVVASVGVPDTGGLDVDAALVARLGTVLGTRDPALWQRLTRPTSAADRRAAWQLWEDVRLAKEMLSRTSAAHIHVPLFDVGVPVGREELERLAQPILDRTVEVTRRAVEAAARSGPGIGLAAIFLVGGASRIPLAATLLHRAFAVAPTALEQPEVVVAEGALHTPTAPASGAPMSSATPTAPTSPVVALPTAAPPATPAATPMAPSAPRGPWPGSTPPPPVGPAPTRRRRIGAAVVVAATAVLVLAVSIVFLVNRESDRGGDAGSGSPQPATTTASFPAGTTMHRLNAARRISIGTKADQPGFGYRETTGQLTGFDVELGRIIAAELGIPASGITWVETPSATREQHIENATVDLVIATYTINDTRKQRVDFAGPYYTAGQQLLVRAGNPAAITEPESLRTGNQVVCSVTGSTPSVNIRQYLADPGRQLVLFDVYQKCVDALLAGTVDAVTSDNVILISFVSRYPGQFHITGRRFTAEPYGIGLRRGDTEFRAWLNDLLEKIARDGRYQQAWRDTAGKHDAGVPSPPAVNRY